MKKIALHWKIIIGLLLGTLWAFLAIKYDFVKFTLQWISPWGVIFLKLLQLIAIPLVMFSIITGIAGLADISKLGRIGGKTILIYVCTTFVAISVGLFLVNSFKPGYSIPEEQRIVNRINYEIWRNENPEVEAVDDRSVLQDEKYEHLIPSNLDIKLADSKIEEKIKKATEVKQKGPLHFLVEIIPDNIVSSLSSNSLLLQVIFFSIFFGIALKKIPENYSVKLTEFFEALNHIYLVMIRMIMNSAPFFVFCLMAGNLTEMVGSAAKGLEGFWSILFSLMNYAKVVLIGLGILLFLVYPFLYVFISQKDSGISIKARYQNYFKSMGPAQLLAFSTSSSAATLPLTMECVNKNLKVSKETTGFVLPIGATINMDGTSLYQAVAVIFLAQLHWIDLNFSQQLTIVLTATLASIGSPAVPGAGLIMLIMVLQSVNLNPAWIAIVLPIDRILDMCRTVINVSGDGVVATLVERWEQNSDKRSEN
jgi:Na+/H+-dicarboxylate symporter